MYQVPLGGQTLSSASVSIATNISSTNASLGNVSITNATIGNLTTTIFSPNTINVSDFTSNLCCAKIERKRTHCL